MNFSKVSIFNISASIILTAINITTNIIESRILGPEGIGHLNIFVSSQTLFATIFALGIGQAAIYFINSQKISEYEILSTTIKSLIPLSALCSVVLFVFIKTLDGYFGIISNLSLTIFVLGTFSLLLTTIFRPVLLAKVEVVKSQTVQYSSALLLLINVMAVASATGGKLTIDAVLILLGISNIFALLILFYFFRKRFTFKGNINFLLLKKIMSFGVKFAASNIAVIVLTNIPILFLSFYNYELNEGFKNVGFFTRASSLLIIGTLINTSVGPLLYSKWSSYDNEQLKKNLKLTVISFNVLNICGSIFLLIFAPFLIRLLYGEAFDNSIMPLRILSLIMIFNGIKEIGYNILSSRGNPIYIFYNLLYSILVLIVGLLLLIPNYGLNGCAAAVVLSTVVSTILIMKKCSTILKVEILSLMFPIPNRQMVSIAVKSFKVKKTCL